MPPKRDRRAVLVATATVDQGGSPVCMYVADRYGRVSEHRAPSADREPSAGRTDGAELRVSADRDGRRSPGVSRPPADARSPSLTAAARGEQADLPSGRSPAQPRHPLHAVPGAAHERATAAGGAQEPE